jgi:kinase
MGQCYAKPTTRDQIQTKQEEIPENPQTPNDYHFESKPTSPKQFFPFYLPSPFPASVKSSPSNPNSTPNRPTTPLHLLKKAFPPPSPAKHIKALLRRRHGSVKPNETSIPEDGVEELGLDKNFGFLRNFLSKYEMGEEVGRGHFGYTCVAKAKKGDVKGEEAAVKVIPKAKV